MPNKDKEKLNVALLTPTFLPFLGGAEIGLHNIAINLIENNVKPIVITSWQSYFAIKKNKWVLPYKVLPLPPMMWRLLCSFPALGFFISSLFYSFYRIFYKIDFWHVTMSFPTGISLIRYAKKSKKAPHIVRCAGSDIQIKKDIKYGIRLDERIDNKIRTYLPQADGLISITKSVYEEYIKLGIDKNKIFEVPNGTDVKRFSTQKDTKKTRQSLNIKEDEFVFLTVGRNHPKKNHKAVVKAVNLFAKENPKIKFKSVIAGKGVKDLEKIKEYEEVKDKIILLEEIGTNLNPKDPKFPSDELIALYQASDVFLFPSYVETFGIVIVEAMAASLPVITSNVEGCRDVCRKGKDALLIENPDDISEITSKMFEIYSNENLRKEYEEKSKKRAKDFSWFEISKKYIKTYKKILGA